MDRKSFFRGFGIGVLFAVTILGISFLIRTSDSYVKSRAKELGMVYASQNSDKVLASDGAASPSPKSSPGASPAEKGTVAPKATGGQKGTQASEKTTSPKETREPAAGKATKEPDAGKATKKPATSSKSSKKDIDMKKEKERMEKSLRDEEKKLTINAGEMSSDVSRKLQSLGVVKSAVDFDKYLEQHGYSSGISAGTYNVSKGDTYSQLAKKITRR